LKIDIINTSNDEEWMKYVHEHPKGNIFHTPYSIRAFQHAKRHEVQLFWAVNNVNKKILAFLPAVRVRLLDGPLGYFTSRSILYGGLLWTENNDSLEVLLKVLNAYDQLAKKDSIVTEVRNTHDTTNAMPYLKSVGYQYEDYLNFTLDLERSEEEIFRSFTKDRRKNIKKSKKKGLVIEEMANKSKMDTFYNILSDSYSRNKVPLADISLFEMLHDNLEDRGMAKFFLSRYKDKYIGAQLCLLYKSKINTFYGASYREWSSYHPDEAMIWYVIKWGLRHNFRLLDLGGAGRPDEEYGVRDYKRRFGGNLVNYGRYKKVHSPHLLKTIQKAYEIYRRIP